MRKITIGFSTAKCWNPFSALIRWWWGTDYSHVYIKWATPWDFDEIMEASGMSVRMVEAETWKRKQKVIHEYEFEITREEFNNMMSLRKLNGKPYGWKQIIGIIIAEALKLKKNPFPDQNRSLVCSELGLKALDVLGYDTGRVNSDRATPQDIKNILDGDA